MLFFSSAQSICKLNSILPCSRKLTNVSNSLDCLREFVKSSCLGNTPLWIPKYSRTPLINSLCLGVNSKNNGNDPQSLKFSLVILLRVVNVIKSSFSTVWTDTLGIGMKNLLTFQSKQGFFVPANSTISVEALCAFQSILQWCKIHCVPLGAKPLQDFVKIFPQLCHLIQI